MGKPTPETFDSKDLERLARETIRSAKFPMLATVEGDQPRVRPVSPVKVDRFTVYVANLRFYGKTSQIAENNKVELCYLDKAHNQVRISALATILSDREEIEAIWEANPLLRQYLGSVDNPDLILYKMIPQSVHYMKEWALEYHEVNL